MIKNGESEKEVNCFSMHTFDITDSVEWQFAFLHSSVCVCLPADCSAAAELGHWRLQADNDIGPVSLTARYRLANNIPCAAPDTAV